VKKLLVSDPEFFQKLELDNTNLIDCIGKVSAIYNKNITRFKAAFDAEAVKAQNKGVPEYKANAWKNVGIFLQRNESPQIRDLYNIGEMLTK
jgi:hypothetical protein